MAQFGIAPAGEQMDDTAVSITLTWSKSRGSLSQGQLISGRSKPKGSRSLRGKQIFIQGKQIFIQGKQVSVQGSKSLSKGASLYPRERVSVQGE